MNRREFVKTSLAGAAALAAPQIGRADARKTINFVPHADLASLDPVWTTADITRNFSLAVYDTLYGYDAEFRAQPQMVEGHTTEDGGKQWNLTLRQALKFHDGAPVLARDCVTTIRRWAKRYPMGQALMARTDELSAVSDRVIRFRLKRPFPLLPEALAEPYCSIMPEQLAKTDPFEQIKEAIGSGPFKFVASERIPGQRVVFEKNPDYVPRADGKPSFSAGPKVVYVDRVVWNFVQDPSTASAALAQGEIDWWENPTIDLIPQLKRNKDLVITASTIPVIFAEAQVATDVLQRIGMNIDLQTMEWGSVVARRASREPVDKGGWNIFYTYLGGMGNISPGPDIAIRASGADAWFGWPSDPKMEALREAWFDAPDLETQQKICREMQVEFWQNPTYVPLGMYDQPMAFHSYLQDMCDGWPQFYGVRRV
jgi:ABC-type transport system substrate-binding protein